MSTFAIVILLLTVGCGIALFCAVDALVTEEEVESIVAEAKAARDADLEGVWVIW